MTSSMSVQLLTGRACTRAVPPRKWAKLVADWAEREGLDAEAAGRAVAAALLHHLSRPRPPALLINYLSQGLEAGLLTARTFALSLLAHMHRSEHSLHTPLLASIATALFGTPTGLDPSEPFPSPITLPTPDVGTSASGDAEPIPALTLMLPLLRQCVSGPPQLLALAARLTALIPPLPAPPFEAGLEAAQLSSVLPEDVAKPLRDCLTGLIADLPMPEAAPAPAIFSDVPIVSGFAELDGVPQLSNLPTTLPLRQMASFLIEYTERAQSWTSSSSYYTVPPQPPQNLVYLIRLGRALTSDSQAYLLALLEAASARVIASLTLAPSQATRAYVFFTEELPVALRWWRDNADRKWPFPSNLHNALGSTFASHTQEMSGWHASVQCNHTAKSAQLMDDDEGGGYTAPEGWSMLSLEETTVRRYLSLGLLDEEQAATLAEGGKPCPVGESLVERLSGVQQHHLEAIAYFISYATGASRSLGVELVNVIKNAPNSRPPENLFLRVAGSPPLLALVTAYITPKSLLELIVTHLLDHVEDQSSRIEDPQTSLTHFGPSVVLADALCAQFDLPLPDLLYDGRRASNIADLTSSEQGHLNGWVKALFGSDGIDDEIILATSSQGLCRLAPTIVQQAIVATMNGQLDLDTLHSGLSYFAQPILSWCLGGVVRWLCAEIERQGILSGVHLNVLQTLVLDSAFPTPLLRANAPAIARLLDPATGLESVMLSSSFDVPGVRARIDAVGGPDGGPVSVPLDPSAPLVTLRAELANVQHLDVVPAGWESRLYDALDTSLRSALPLLEGVISTDILYPPTIDTPPNSPEVQFLAFVSVLHMPYACAPPLAVALINAYLPHLFTHRSPFVPLAAMPAPTPTMLSSTTPAHTPPPLPFASHALHSLLRGVLLAADAYGADEGGFSDYLASHLADEFACQRARPVSNSPPSKRAKVSALGIVDALCPEQKELICELVTLFESDDEIRARWPNLTPLSTMGPATGPAS
ncbi:hypothetical protein CcaverHIS002_0201340 [Cutaneotrichosporon cavernicola]|uniref:Mediator of RNA polymerase II transcription subunit 5 n=1 Tax=Cutaneotrichosporon cavernicola TaxID=279322 RepID=A0AA48L1E5_9TREE|nr:uncharacterized protein CcaverHIS019_0201390 [Cutaneotrichosporon cavernicola]BEI80974.1 hypothetical protein CcaverHIS002_0201340 [Cutaneotrichosporon cavernicola]BEI88777.1 hypothetical protein CcaverHIS019_0201390 [Cutaneotrichosporon cavernicola]BEI96552.1 hypothetical protein CcaverHIS631_0201410 [Cutaneotrichosporon cavernicola]BEJ04324.1 hypothetical protein CcaverHIS641_0201410 [Cutaneotrichosporon cavernicola]